MGERKSQRKAEKVIDPLAPEQGKFPAAKEVQVAQEVCSDQTRSQTSPFENNAKNCLLVGRSKLFPVLSRLVVIPLAHSLKNEFWSRSL